MGVLGQTSEGMQWVWEELNVKGFGANSFEGGETLSITAKKANARSFRTNRVGVMRTPGRTGMLKKPTRVTHQALLLDQGLNIMLVFAHLGFVTACISGQNIRVLKKPFLGECSKHPTDWVLPVQQLRRAHEETETRTRAGHTHTPHIHTPHTHTPHPHPTHTHPTHSDTPYTFR